MVISVRICLSPILRIENLLKPPPKFKAPSLNTNFNVKELCDLKKKSSVSLYFRHLDNADLSFRQGRSHDASLSFVMKVKREPAEMDVQHRGLSDPFQFHSQSCPLLSPLHQANYCPGKTKQSFCHISSLCSRSL